MRPFRSMTVRRSPALPAAGALFPALALLCLAASAGPAAGAAAPGPPPGQARVVLDAGVIYLWDLESPDLAPAPEGLLPPGDTPLAVVDPGDRRGALVLRGVSEPADRDRRRHEGEALLLAWSAASGTGGGYTLAWTARFEGLPRAAAAAASRAWVLTRRTAGTDDAEARLWLHELDRTSGRVEDTTVLPGPAASVAADPLGRRVFISLDDRILSLTTRPLVASWHYRSPGKNGILCMSPSGGVLAAARDLEVALFDMAAIAARPAHERRDRHDDATSVVPLPLHPELLRFSDDGRLLAVFGGGGLLFIEVASGAVILPETAATLTGSAAVTPMQFPGSGRDLVVAAFPAAAVTALPAPTVSGPAQPAALPEAAALPRGAPAPPAQADLVPPSPVPQPSAPPAGAPPPAAPAMAGIVSPDSVPPPPANPPPAPGGLPEPPGTVEPAQPGSPPASVPTSPEAIGGAVPSLGGRITGDRARVRAIVLYGPNSIIREQGRVGPDAGGTWRLPLPPPGVYRVVAIGDGSTPIPVSPGFLTVTVAAGESIPELDFAVGTTP